MFQFEGGSNRESRGNQQRTEVCLENSICVTKLNEFRLHKLKKQHSLGGKTTVFEYVKIMTCSMYTEYNKIRNIGLKL